MGVESYHVFAHVVPRDEGGTREAYGPGLGRESLSWSPSSKTTWRSVRVKWGVLGTLERPFLAVSHGEEEMLGIQRVSLCESALAPTSYV